MRVIPTRLAAVAGSTLIATFAACTAATSGHATSTASVSGASSAGSGGAGGHGAGAAGSGGGSISIGSSGVGSGGGPTCMPAALPAPGDCTSMGIHIEAPYASDYTCVDLGTLPSVPAPWGGFAVKANDPSTLLITGNARTPAGRLHAVPIGRDAACHISGFTGSSTDVAEAPYNEAGIGYGPGGVLFLAEAVVNKLGELLPGSAMTDKVVDLGALGQAPTTCGVGFVPSMFPEPGRLKLINWPSPGYWYDATLVPDDAGTGTYDVTSVSQKAQLPNGAAGFVFIAGGNTDFPTNSVLVSEYNIGSVAAYALQTTASDPDATTRKPFITGLTGAQGGVVDPVSGDFLFSTYSTARIIGIRGFKPPPPPPG